MRPIVFLSILMLASAYDFSNSTKAEFEFKINDTQHQKVAQPFGIESLVGDRIAEFAQYLAENGFDPLFIGHQMISLGLPDKTIEINGEVHNLKVKGLSDIKVDSVSFRIIPPSLTFNIVMPYIQVWGGPFDGLVQVYGQTHHIYATGWIAVCNLRVTGRASLRIGNPIRITGINAALTIEDVQSDLKVNIDGEDYSDYINYSLNKMVQNVLLVYDKTINEWLNVFLLEILQNV